MTMRLARALWLAALGLAAAAFALLALDRALASAFRGQNEEVALVALLCAMAALAAGLALWWRGRGERRWTWDAALAAGALGALAGGVLLWSAVVWLTPPVHG